MDFLISRSDPKLVLKGTPVTKAGLVVYQLEKINKGGGGGQSSGLLSSLSRNFELVVSPNPVITKTTITYVLPTARHISLRLFDAVGRLIRILDKGSKTAGGHRIDISTEKLSQGVYFLRLETSNETKVKKLIILK